MMPMPHPFNAPLKKISQLDFIPNKA